MKVRFFSIYRYFTRINFILMITLLCGKLMAQPFSVINIQQITETSADESHLSLVGDTLYFNRNLKENPAIHYLDTATQITSFEGIVLHNPHRLTFYNGEASTLRLPPFNNYSGDFSGYIDEKLGVILLSIESQYSYGVNDIYVWRRDASGRYNGPVNLGSRINTQLDEFSPVLSPDGRMLFFTSNGHGGKGSFDIFMSRRLDDSWRSWTAPQPLPNINTEGREAYLTMSFEDRTGYYTSTKNSNQMADIYRFNFLTDTVDESVTNDGFIYVLANEPGTAEYKPAYETNWTSVAIGEEPLLLENLIEGVSYDFRVNNVGYMYQETSILARADTSVVDLTFSSLEKGAIIQLPDILFEQGKAVLLEQSYVALRQLLITLQRNQDLEIELRGHTDSRGNARLNLELSRERVEVIKSYLVGQGVDEDRITGKGFGGRKPIADNSSEETRRLNRRVEIRIR